MIAAWKEDEFDLLTGYARRHQGNYHAGKNGEGASAVDVGARWIPAGTSGGYDYYPHYIENTGISNYRTGEEVLNTALDTESFLAKGTVRFGDGHSLQLGYTGFRSEAGDLRASYLNGERAQPVQQRLRSGSTVDTGTLRYRWNPEDSDIIDLKANLWITNFKSRSQPFLYGNEAPENYGLDPDFRTGTNTLMWGGDVSNTSTFFVGDGSLSFDYGLSYIQQGTKPSAYSDILLGGPVFADGERREISEYLKTSYKPFDWLTLKSGVKYSHFSSENRRGSSATWYSGPTTQSDGGFSPSAGIVLKPFSGVQLYTNYSNTMRFPSMVEAMGVFTVIDPDLVPENASNWELGANFTRDGLFQADDRAMLKVGYYNWDIDNYISRDWWTNPQGISSMRIHNIDRAKFSGLELSGRYESGGFSAELTANYVLDIEYCRVAGSCGSRSLYADYATNHVPPKYTLGLTLTQKMFEDRLTFGGRVFHVGSRAIGHGDGTPAPGGAADFISQVSWKPYTLIDLSADYKISDNLTANLSIENLTDQYYIDPLGLVNQPAPGRTIRLGITGTLGSGDAASLSSSGWSSDVASIKDWSGAFITGSMGYDFVKSSGNRASLGGTVNNAFDDSFSDFSATVGTGYDHHIGNGFVAGIEADISRPFAGNSTDVFSTESPQLTRQQPEASYKTTFDWMTTVRGRLGYAFNDNLMVYATGGAAILRENSQRTQFRQAANQTRVTEPMFTESESSTRTGYTVGGGFEYALGGGWSLRSEFLLSGFGKKETEFKNAREGVLPDTKTISGYDFTLPGCTIPFWETCANWVDVPGSYSKPSTLKVLQKITIPSIKVGLTYRF